MVAQGNNQYEEANILRDINKAYIGFLPNYNATSTVDKFDVVSTGNWGSGAFAGDVTLKFIQQLLAASAAKVSLEYSTFKNASLENRLTNIYNVFKSRDLNVSQVFELIRNYHSTVSSEKLDRLEYIAKSVFREIKSTASFHVTGNGSFQKL